MGRYPNGRGRGLKTLKVRVRIPLALQIREVAEWSKAADLKSAVVQATGGSNPSFSAKILV
jgi:hypothetical protein